MDIYKNKIFSQWAKSENVTDSMLINTIDEIEKGLYEANLGSALYKKRVAMNGKGKRGGYRTLVAFKEGQRAFFVYGFSKNKQDNINENEKRVYRNLAKDFLSMNECDIQKMLNAKKLYKVIL